jgi:hypothetical protein
MRSTFIRTYAPAGAAILLAGCLNVDPATTGLPFDFTSPGLANGWILGVADLPVARSTEVNAAGGEFPLPASFSATGDALYQAGTNVSGDLFLFHEKYIGSVRPNTDYKVSFQIEFVTNIHSGCTTGPGPFVVIKVGVTSVEPTATPDAQGVLRMNIDKGAGTARGVYAQLGDIRNGLAGCPATGTYAAHTTATIRQTELLHTDDLGGFFMFIGTQSSFAGRHEIYITSLTLNLQPQNQQQ